jgi:hypothetical protein
MHCTIFFTRLGFVLRKPAASCATALALNLLLTTAASATGTIADFENAADVTSWSFYNGAEYPGARGAIVSTSSLGRKCAELQYDFTPIVGSTAAFDPHYVLAQHAVSDLQAAGATGVHFLLQPSSPDLHVSIRITDTSGQTLQYAVSGLIPLTARSSLAWRDSATDLAKPSQYWSGANDGVIHPPIKTIAVLLDATNKRDTGYVRFDNIELVSAPSSTPSLVLTSGTLVAPGVDLGQLADRAGVNIHFTNNSSVLDLIKAAGLRWVRMDFTWSAIEQTAGKYDFSAFDTLVSAAEARGLSVLAILDYGNALYTGGGMTPPRTTAAITAYAAYCTATASRYAGRKVVFEIWNEPDVAGFWGGTPSATEYAAVLKAGLAAVKSGNSSARALTGGLSVPYDLTYSYWDTLQSLGAMTGAGGWGTHLYTDGPPEERWTDILRLNDRVASVMPGQALWCTEWGYSSTKLSLSSTKDGHESLARTAQANRDVRELLVSWWANLPLLVLYDIYDDGSDPQNAEHNFGLLAQDYSEKPAMTAVRTLLSFANGRSLAGLMQYSGAPAGVHVFRLDGTTDCIYIVWAEESAPACNLLVPDLTAKVKSMTGQPLTTTTVSNQLSLALTSALGPVFVQIATATIPPSNAVVTVQAGN